MTNNIVDEALAKLQATLAEAEARRTLVEQELDACLALMNITMHRISAVHAATSTLASVPSEDADEKWLGHLTTWRKTLSDELAALPRRIRDDKTLGVQQNLRLSIRAIDLGPDVTNGTGYDLTTLRLGALMIETGYEVIGADPDRHYAGTLPWHGSLPEVERRIAAQQKLRAEAEARLADALLDDAERERRAAENQARIDALNAVPVRKMRGDGSVYDRYPDGRRVEVS